jgi:hypothetical protein
MKIEWMFDWPQHMVHLGYWFWWRGEETWNGVMYNHFRVLGVRRRITVEL